MFIQNQIYRSKSSYTIYQILEKNETEEAVIFCLVIKSVKQSQYQEGRTYYVIKDVLAKVNSI
jgi:hypothetical protein